MPRRFVRLVALAAFLLPIGAATVAVTAPAVSADTRICDPWGTTSTGGKYQVMNNRWGTSATQCINVTNAGFSIVQQDGAGDLGGAPVSYPAIYVGCHYSVCSPATNLPMKISDISGANTNVSIAYPSSGVFNASYDIWLNATADVSGLQDTEIMLWVHHTGSPHPVGSNTGTISLAGHSWEVWVGNNGQNNVVSYMTTGITTFNEDLMPFIRDAMTRGSGFGDTSWYLTSMQMGFEPWIGGVGLSVDNFSAAVNTGIPPTTPPTIAPTTPPTTSPTGAPGTCSAAIKIDNSWGTGFQGTVTVTAGSSPITGWAVTWNWPGSQTITNSWNAAVTSSGTAVTARNLSYNGSLSAGGNATFGLQATGSNATPALSCGANGAPPTTPPTVAPTTPPTVAPTTPPTVAPTTPPTVAPTTPPTIAPTGAPGTCSAAIKIDNSWGTGFQATVTVTAGSSAITGWTVTWNWPGSQAIANGWNATVTSSGKAVTAQNMSYNGSLGGGGNTAFGLQVNGSSATPILSCAAN